MYFNIFEQDEYDNPSFKVMNDISIPLDNYPPTRKGSGDIAISLASVRLSVCPSVRPSVRP